MKEWEYGFQRMNLMTRRGFRIVQLETKERLFVSKTVNSSEIIPVATEPEAFSTVIEWRGPQITNLRPNSAIKTEEISNPEKPCVSNISLFIGEVWLEMEWLPPNFLGRPSSTNR
ncbi:hypothetical protein X801_05137 [Opisthorchis viverrini]|uniref:Uncharacterized protein n=2 Tax=Opisthorchis viverrini TaxID=6198 RepID=A0A1S8WXM6_OPIVI|nr:hypothetical protein T265_02508 [Opisthorchis viverrini]KER31182.1 hypothetical protein T265_02508 [Opisthorchis viverrini]OON19003.1 hypothetical protein X801_05137 [Opisthorchis viverrini]